MASWRAYALALVVLTGGAALVFLASCGDSAAEEELREYSRWVDTQHARQTELLMPIETGGATLETFVNELPRMRRSGQLAPVYAAARSASDLLHTIRDRVRPAHAKFREEIEAMKPETEAIAEVHRRFARAVELRDRAIVTLSAVADRVDELLAYETVEGDPDVNEKVRKLATAIQGTMGESIGVFRTSDKPLAEAARETLEALGAAGEAGSDPARAAQGMIARQETLYTGFTSRLQSAGQDDLVPLLTVLDERMIPDYDQVVSAAAALELPTPSARTSWKKVVDLLRKRAEALRLLPPLREKIQRIDALAQDTPQMAAAKLVDAILERAPSAGDDLQQALGMYENFATELRRLRADML